ncbi:MAG: exo-alpha-sialidase [Oscillospiraceae bacterium]|nr:exo-alpha-sialidase [Oscillospiraceae bacterium]
MVKNTVKEFIFDENPPSPSCHASTVLPLPGGDVLAAWFGGTNESADDVDVFVSRRTAAGWCEPARISQDRSVAHWNPVLFQQKDGTVVLFFKVGRKIPYWKTFAVKSRDGGLTWGEPYELVPGDESGGRGPVKNKAIRLLNGTVLAPASSEQPEWLSFVDISKDDGGTWEKQMIIPVRKRMGVPVPMIQPTLWESEPGRVHMLIRTAARHAYRSDSEDFGVTWCKAYPTAVRNNNSGLDVDKLPDGSLILISNPVAKNWGTRAPLTLMRSTDNGVMWEEIFVLEKRGHGEDEFSYPAIVYADGALHMVYTWHRRKIVYWKIDIE